MVRSAILISAGCQDNWRIYWIDRLQLAYSDFCCVIEAGSIEKREGRKEQRGNREERLRTWDRREKNVATNSL